MGCPKKGPICCHRGQKRYNEKCDSPFTSHEHQLYTVTIGFTILSMVSHDLIISVYKIFEFFL